MMNRECPDISICALVPYPPNTTPSQRFRIEQWNTSLAAQGIFVDLLPFMDLPLMRLLHRPEAALAKAVKLSQAFLRRCRNLNNIRQYDAVFIHRAACLAGPALLERIIALFGCPIIYDFDDAIFHLDTHPSNRHFGWLKFPGKTASICRLSSQVIVGNAYLADYARRYNDNVKVIPSSVDLAAYHQDPKKAPQGGVVIGWTGSSTSQAHLESFAPLLYELRQQREFSLHIISDREPQLPGLPITWHRWSPETEIVDLARFDIGIMPMPDDPWARGKCSMKALLYMAMGIPAICSAVGMNQEVIQSGKNGLLARTPQEWLTCLRTLIDDPAVRQRLGAAGRQTIENRFSMQHCAAQLAQVIRHTIRKKDLTSTGKKPIPYDS